MSTLMRVSAVVVNFNGGADLIECIRSLKSQTHHVAEIIVVDNVSTDRSMEDAIAHFPDITPIANATNTGFAGGANKGAIAATGDMLLFLNPDVSLSPLSVQGMCEQLDRCPGVVGAALSLDADIQDLYGCTVDRLGYPISLRLPGKPLYVPGAVLATSRTLFQMLGGFDDRYFMFVEDVDYCWRVLLSGFEVSMSAGTDALHRGGAAAPGGYIRSGRIETTVFRFVLRERNSLAVLLKCAPVVWLIWIVPTYVVKTAILVIGAIALRKLKLARGLVAALVWNFSQGPRTIRLRRAIDVTPDGQRTARQRIYRGWLAIERLRKYGLPRFVDQPGASAHSAKSGDAADPIASEN